MDCAQQFKTDFTPHKVFLLFYTPVIVYEKFE